MKKPRSTLMAALAIVAATVSGAAIDVKPVEKTVAERVKHMDVVLHVRAVSQPIVTTEDHAPTYREQGAQIEGPVLFLMVEQDVQVLEVIKGDSFAVRGTTIRVTTGVGHNGLRLAPGWRYLTMAEGGTYVLFLSHRPYYKGFLAYDPHDLFRLDRPRVTAPYDDDSAYAKTLIRMTPTEALAHIRNAVKTSQP